MDCREFWEIADSYLSDELTIESNHEAISHVEKCAKCRSELSARRAVRTKLREAFVAFPANRVRPEFMNKLTGKLRDAAVAERTRSFDLERARRIKRYSVLAIAACLLLALLIGVIIVRQQSSGPEQRTAQTGPGDQQIPIAIVRTELAKAAAGDHRDCAVRFRLAEKPIDLELAGQKYDPVYIGLKKSIFTERGVLPPGFQLVEAHSCVFQGRRFAHLVLKYRGSLLSILVTGIPAGAEVHASSLNEPPSIVCSQIDDYNVSFFQTARHAIFVVSELPEGDNLALTRELAPGIMEHIRNSEDRIY